MGIAARGKAQTASSADAPRRTDIWQLLVASAVCRQAIFARHIAPLFRFGEASSHWFHHNEQ